MKRTLMVVVVALSLSAAALVLFVARCVVPGPATPRVTEPSQGAARASGDAFPWDGATVLTAEAGQQLSWLLERVDGGVHLTGVHPSWRVEHHARADFTPLVTVKQSNGITTRLTWLPDGARVDRTDALQKKSSVTIHEPGLWDGSTLVARLAAVSWAPGKQVRFRIADLDLADGTVYPLIAEYVRQERCGNEECHRVHLALDDFRRLVSPSSELYFSTGPGAQLLRYDGEGFTFRSPGP